MLASLQSNGVCAAFIVKSSSICTALARVFSRETRVPWICMVLAHLTSSMSRPLSIVCREQSLCKTSPVAYVRMCSSLAYHFIFPRGCVCVFCTRLLTTAVHHHNYYCTITTTTVCTLLRWNALQMCISQHTFMNWVEFGVVPSREEYFHLPHKSLVGLFQNVLCTRPVVVSLFLFVLCCECS